MYESGLSTPARIIFLIMAVLLGIVFIMISGCRSANASDLNSKVVIETVSGTPHAFF